MKGINEDQTKLYKILVSEDNINEILLKIYDKTIMKNLIKQAQGSYENKFLIN